MGIASFVRFLLTGHPVVKAIDIKQALSENRYNAVDILVGDEHLLVRETAMPKLNTAQLKRAVGLNIQSQTPFDLETITFGFRVLGNEGNNRKVRQYLLRRSLLKEWTSKLESAGVTVRRFRAKSAPSVVLHDSSLQIMQRYKPWHKANVTLCACILAILGTAAWQNVTGLDKQVQLAQDRVQSLRQDVAELRRELEASTDQSSGFSLIAARQSDAARMLEHVDLLTELLPDGTWVSTLALEQAQLRVSGNTTYQPVDLISFLAEADLFDVPVLTNGFELDDGSGQKRFEISLPYALEDL